MQKQLGKRTGNSKLLQIMVTPREHALLMELAANRNTTVSEIMRQQVKALLSETAQLVAA